MAALKLCYIFDPIDIPMCRNLPQPCHTGILHRRTRVQALGDGMGNGGLALFGEQGQELFLLGNQGVDFHGLAVEEGRDGGLFFLRWLG